MNSNISELSKYEKGLLYFLYVVSTIINIGSWTSGPHDRFTFVDFLFAVESLSLIYLWFAPFIVSVFRLKVFKICIYLNFFFVILRCLLFPLVAVAP